jgi:hypothetical protein
MLTIVRIVNIKQGETDERKIRTRKNKEERRLCGLWVAWKLSTGEGNQDMVEYKLPSEEVPPSHF